METATGFSMRSAARYGVAIVAAVLMIVRADAQTPDDSLDIYAVNVIKTPPFQKQFTGDGIYLGNGLVITAAHVVGHWPFFTRPRILIGGQDLRAKIIKNGSFGEIDLALLSIDATQLPMSIQLRRDPLCTSGPKTGMEVIDVNPTGTTRAHIISPLTISPKLQGRFNTLIDTVEPSGSGLFDAEKKCLVGIISAKVPEYANKREGGHIVSLATGFAGYFVPASRIIDFIPPAYHF
jgi:hypothetical protein